MRRNYKMSRRNKYEKPKNFKKTWMNLLSYIKEYIPVIVLVLLASIVASVLQVLGPNKLKELTDVIAEGLPQMINGEPVLSSINMEAVRSITLLLVTFYVTSALIDFVRS